MTEAVLRASKCSLKTVNEMKDSRQMLDIKKKLLSNLEKDPGVKKKVLKLLKTDLTQR